MKCPRKIYLIISKKDPATASGADVVVGYEAAKAKRDERNRLKTAGVDDWRIETFVKGD